MKVYTGTQGNTLWRDQTISKHLEGNLHSKQHTPSCFRFLWWTTTSWNFSISFSMVLLYGETRKETCPYTKAPKVTCKQGNAPYESKHGKLLPKHYIIWMHPKQLILRQNMQTMQHTIQVKLHPRQLIMWKHLN